MAIHDADDADKEQSFQALLDATRDLPRDDVYLMARHHMQNNGVGNDIVKRLIQTLDSEDEGDNILRQKVYKVVMDYHQNRQRKPNQYARWQEISEDGYAIVSNAMKTPVIAVMANAVFKAVYGKQMSERIEENLGDVTLNETQQAIVDDMITDLS